MNYALGFDIYGTLVDPLEMNQHLRAFVGEDADQFSALWREKQLEYSFRRGLMGKYENFQVCTQQALIFTAQTMKVEISSFAQAKLLEEYQNLSAFADVLPGLHELKAQGHKLVAFSNGAEETVRTLLERTQVLAILDNVISVDDLETFKPNPAVYKYLARRLKRPMNETWLISSNPWDVIGAKSVGLKSAWIKRTPDKVFDPWGIEPDLVATTLEELAMSFRK
ncbi:MAG: haloacid dehalogenase type II [Rhizonema sp. PD37]|nr:haloacid dehalogenase type II [Rhizonema sp. PD37]